MSGLTLLGGMMATGVLAPPTTLDVDFTGYTLGPMSAAAFLTASGLTFTRTTTSTVQTSASALDSTPAINDACIGDKGIGRGLVLQQNTWNRVGAANDNSPRDLTVSWTPGTATVTAAYAAGPDGVAPGVGCSRTNGTSGQYAPFGSHLNTDRYTFSSWQRSKDSATNGNMQQVWITSVPGDGIQVTRAASDTWARLQLSKGTTSRQYFDVCDGRNYTASGGDAAAARDVLVDYIQYEAGDFTTEAIPKGRTLRSNDALSYASGSNLIAANGQIKFYAKIITKFASTNQVYYDGTGGFPTVSAAWFLFSFGANNYAKIKDSDKKLYVKIAGGTEVASTNAISFALNDVVEFDVQVGNNVASVARYKINGGSWVDMVLATIPDVPSPGGAVSLFRDDSVAVTADTGQPPCWLQHIKFFRTGGPV